MTTSVPAYRSVTGLLTVGDGGVGNSLSTILHREASMKTVTPLQAQLFLIWSNHNCCITFFPLAKDKSYHQSLHFSHSSILERIRLHMEWVDGVTSPCPDWFLDQNLQDPVENNEIWLLLLLFFFYNCFYVLTISEWLGNKQDIKCF